jgi:MOSC domain-containing protein YiiM
MTTSEGQAGSVVSVNVAPEKGTRKKPVGSAELVLDRGVAEDAHAGDWHRQVSLLAQESVDKMVAKGLDVGPGDFGENLTTSGLDLVSMPLGTQLAVGDSVVLEISQIGKECHDRCAIYYQAGDCVMPREGVFGVVIEAGPVSDADPVVVVAVGDGTCARTPDPEEG